MKVKEFLTKHLTSLDLPKDEFCEQLVGKDNEA